MKRYIKSNSALKKSRAIKASGKVSDSKRFIWNRHGDNYTFWVEDTFTGKSAFVKKNQNGRYTVDGCPLTDSAHYTGYPMPHTFSKSELLAYLKEEFAKDSSPICESKRCKGKSVMASDFGGKYEYTQNDVNYYEYTINPSKLYYGCPGAYFIWNGAYSDAYVEYKGYLYNTADIDDALYSYYNEWCEENGEEPSDEEFEEFASGEVESMLYDSTPFAKVTDSHGRERVAEGVDATDVLPDFWKD